jgi:NitT/TauT family transport system substrate-binding protein
MKARWRFPLVTMLCVLACAVAGCSSSSHTASKDGLTTVSIGQIPGLEGSGLLAVAQSQGYWKQAGLQPSVKSFTNGPLEIQAMQTGDLDFAYVGNGAMWLVASGKAKVISLAAMSAGDRVIAQPGITNIAQLKGKTVGVPQGTSGEIVLQLALQKAGMSESDVKVVNMDPATIVPAFLSKRIDAAGIWYPLISTIKQKMPGVNELAKDSDFSSQLAFPDVFIATNGLVNKHLDIVKKVISVLQKANDYRFQNMSDTVSLTAKYINQPLSVMQAQVATAQFFSTSQLAQADANGTANGWFNSLAAYFKKTGKLDSVADAKTYYLGDVYNQVYNANKTK